MFVDDNYNDYIYVVSVSDNYIVLTNRSSVTADWQNQKTIPVIYQYINPSFITIEGTKTYSQSVSFDEIDTSSSFYERADCLDIIKVQFIIIFFLLFLFNAMTRFCRKGGVIFGQ